MRTLTHAVAGLLAVSSLIACSGTAVAASKRIAPNPAQSVNVRLSDLPHGFVAGVNGIENHDDDSAAHKAAAYADDADYYWKNASGQHSVEVSTTIEYYSTPAEAVKYMPANALAAATAGLTKMPAGLHAKVQACSIGEVCIYTSELFLTSPVGAAQYRSKNYLVSVMVCETGTSLPVPGVEAFAYSLAGKVAARIR